MKDVVIVGGVFREILEGDTNPRFRMGGSGLTSVLVAARLGAKSALTSYVGREDAQTVEHMLEAAGVDTGGLAILSGASGTFVFPRETGESQPWPMYRPAERTPIRTPEIAAAKLYLVFGIPDFDPIREGWFAGLPEAATLLWDRQGWMSRARDCRLASILPPRERYYLANYQEALEEFPPTDSTGRYDNLPPDGFSAALIKRGTKGCTVVRNGFHTTFDAFGVDNPGSTIGSGDAFAGGLAAAISLGATVEEATVVANAAAATFLVAGGDPLVDGFSDSVRSLVASQGDVNWNVD